MQYEFGKSNSIIKLKNKTKLLQYIANPLESIVKNNFLDLFLIIKN